MGTVFRACDLARGGRWVAVKVLPNQDALPRFEREVTALAGVDDEVIVRYVDHGRSDGGEAFVAMEWIEGQSLSERLAVSGLSGLDTVLLGQRLAAGLSALHAAGLVHRDLKPSNVMLPSGGVASARIVDLGIARLPGEAVNLTAAGAHLGTPRYMAPEQIRDPHAVDGRADVFSLGCVLFECITGSPAFPGEESVSVLAQVLFGRTPEASEHRPELPDELDALLEQLLSRSRKLRPYAAPLVQSFGRLLEPPHRQRLESVLPRAAKPSTVGRGHALDATLPSEPAAGSHERPSVALLLPPGARARRAASARRSAPPIPSGPWIGRDAELAEVCALIERARVVTIWGGAGVGKTRLALEVSRVLGGLRPEQTALFCELSEARDSADIVRVVSERAGLPLSASSEPEALLGALLGKLGDILLILDRCEHLTAELEPLLTLWAASAPGLSVLATSRSRLRSTRELDLQPLATRAPNAPPPAAGAPLSEGAELVLARTALALGASDALAEEPEARACAERIASALDGNPLAIELASAHVPVLGLEGVIARLPAQLALLSDRSAGNTMRGAIAWSWDLLGDAERLACMQCAVFRGSFTLAAAEGIVRCAPGEHAEARILELVQALREQSLLSSAPLAGSSSMSMRLTMSAALREFALTQLAIARARHPELAELEARHARYYTELARSVIDPRNALSAAARIARRQEHDNLVAAATHVLETNQPLAAATLLSALEPALLAAGSNSPLTALLERALAMQSPADREHARARVRLRGVHARLLAPAGELARAMVELEQIRSEAEALADPGLLASIWLDLGVVHHFGRDLSAAVNCYQHALEQLEHVDDVVAEARCHGNLGAVAHDRGHLPEAARGYRHAIALLEDGVEPRLLANFRGNLALLEHELGAYDSALRLYSQAASGLEDACDVRLLGIVLANWGTLELWVEPRSRTAAEMLLRAQALLDGCGDRRSLGLTAGRLAAAHALAGRIDDAEACAGRAERLLRRDPLGRIVVGCLRGFIDLGRARAAAAAGDRARARHELEGARGHNDRALREQYAGRAAHEQSDDLRLYSALLAREVAGLEGALSDGALVAG